MCKRANDFGSIAVSIIRLSCDRCVLHAPGLDGTLIDTPYSASNETGRIGSFTEKIPTTDADLQTLRAHLNAKINAHAAKLRANQPVVVFVHGFLFDPYHIVTQDPKDTNNPHGRLYHFNNNLSPQDEIRDHTTSWPLGLGFENGDEGKNGLCIAFGWHSAPGLAKSLIDRFQNFYARAYDYGTETAWVFGVLLNELVAHPLLANHRIDIFCHSLGSHVITRSLATAAKGPLIDPSLAALDRVVFLGGAEYVVEAQIMYSRIIEAGLKANQGPTFYNIGCRENDVLDKLGENFGPRTFGNTNIIGHNGLAAAPKAPRWIDLQIDSGELRDWLKAYDKLDVSGDQPGTIWDHWYYYTYHGNMQWFNRLLRNRTDWTLAALRNHKRGSKKSPIPEGIEEGWFFGD